MTIEQHVEAIKASLENVEKQHKQAGKAIAKLHKDLQTALEEAGEGCGLSPGQITTYGGGTPKTPNP